MCKYECVLVCLCVSANVLLLKSIQSFASKSQLKDWQGKVKDKSYFFYKKGKNIWLVSKKVLRKIWSYNFD